MKLRLIEQACGCSMVRGGEADSKGVCSSLPLALLRRVLAASHQAPRHVQVVCLCDGSRHEAPTDRASVRVVDSATSRRRPTQRVHARLCCSHSRGECLALGTKHQAHAREFALQVVCLCDGSRQMQLRLIEQAYGCSTVRGGGGLKVCACLCRWHTGGEGYHCDCQISTARR